MSENSTGCDEMTWDAWLWCAAIVAGAFAGLYAMLVLMAVAL